jgi:hypothetical protein
LDTTLPSLAYVGIAHERLQTMNIWKWFTWNWNGTTAQDMRDKVKEIRQSQVYTLEKALQEIRRMTYYQANSAIFPKELVPDLLREKLVKLGYKIEDGYNIICVRWDNV